jgi:hypothetical protein
MLDKTTVGYSLEGLFVVAGLIVLIRLWRSARHDPASTVPRLWPRNAFTADLLFFLIAICVPMLLGQLAASYGGHFFPQADAAHLTLGATYVVEFAMLAVIAVYYSRGPDGWSATSLRAGPPAFDPASTPEPPRLPPRPAISTGVATFLAALPAVYLVSALWQTLLDACGFPVAHQNIVEVFLGLDTPLTQILFTIVAGVLVPINEEMIFRGGLFRGLRAAVPRRWAIGISALVFGAAHFDITSFAPLVVLGVVFALAYERTGNIRTVIVAHALFNLNTLGGLLLGINS